MYFCKLYCALFWWRPLQTQRSPQNWSGTDARKPQCNVNNYFYTGPNTKKIEQQLAEIKEEIKALKENRTSGGGSSGKGLKHGNAFILLSTLVLQVALGLTPASGYDTS